MPKFTYRYKSINRLVGKVIHSYDMISEGDKLAVGVSGGVDSLTLIWALNERRKRIPVNFELVPIYIDLGFNDSFAMKLINYCNLRGYKLSVEYSKFGIMAHSNENKESPCFLCSRQRRQRLFEVALRLGCNKLALGHNKDDVIETLFLNLFYSGNISTMVPSQTFFKGKMRIIRPLAFVDKSSIIHFANERKIPEFLNPCPSVGKSKREYIKNMLKTLYKDNSKVKGNIFRALGNVKKDYLLN